MAIDALSVLCAQLTRDLLAIAKFLYCISLTAFSYILLLGVCRPLLPGATVEAFCGVAVITDVTAASCLGWKPRVVRKKYFAHRH